MLSPSSPSSPSSRSDSSPHKARNLTGLTPEQRIKATLGAKPRRRPRRRHSPSCGVPRESEDDATGKNLLSKALSFTNVLSTKLLAPSSIWMKESRGRLVRSASTGISSGLSGARRLSRALTKRDKVVEQLLDQESKDVEEPCETEPLEPVESKPVATEFQLPHAPVIESECEPKQKSVDFLTLESSGMQCVENASEARHELMRCIENDQVGRIRQMLSPSQADPLHIPVDLPNEAGESPALCAARTGHAKSCAVFLDNGADPLARDRSVNFFGDGIGVWPDEIKPDGSGYVKIDNPRAKAGRTVVYFLRMQGIFEETLAEMWPATRIRVLKAIAHALQDFHQRSPLILAATRGYVDLAALLLTHTVALPSSVVAPPPRSAPPALSASLPTSLQEVSSQKQVSVPSDRAEALLAACSCQHWQIALVVLAAGVTRSSIDVAKDKQDRTPLHLAAAAGQDRLVEMLLQAGASPHVWSRRGRQPLHEAATAGHAEVCASLLEGGASLETRVGEWGTQGKSSRQITSSGDMHKNALEICMDRGHVHSLERMATLQDAGHAKSLQRTRMF
eukprot:TRINITY_DN24214_c0_g2_i1.p1 TRINITY_DN24214_c0_g2~~TRINITY_DN24214_c0_g2_i1.p1  ORF type:complete len:565 (-),score=79.21 TRINITY_DN24214_c0_g2_i1:56-1750(-)